MFWPVFVLLPLVFATLAFVAVARRTGPQVLVLGAIICAVAESAVFAFALGSWSWLQIVAAWSLSVLTPWVAAFAFAWLVALRRGERWWATAVPVVYVAALAAGVAVGDASGWVPQ